MVGSHKDERIRRLLEQRDASSVEALVAARYGFDAPRVDPMVVDRLLQALPPASSLADVEEAVVEAAVVGETFFLRHRVQLDWLERSWLPSVRRAPPARALQILFAGCSSGEEVWSFLGRLGPALRTAHPAGVRVAAVDVSERALGVARGRRYRAWSLRGVDLEANRSWLRSSQDGAVQVVDALAEPPVRFVRHNLLDPLDELAPPGGFDLVFCRNMLLYLDDGSRARVWDHLLAVLAPRGVLLTAPTDPALPSRPDLHRCWHGRVPVHHRGAPPAPPALESPPASAGPPAPSEGPPSPRPRPARRAQPGRAPAVRAVTSPAASMTSAPEPRSAVHLAARLAATGRADLARSILEDEVVARPEDVDALVLLAMLASEGGDRERAVAAARQATYLAPGTPYPTYVMAVVLQRAGRPEPAQRRREAARALLEGLDPAAPLPHADGLVAGQLRAILGAR